ncbi:iron complex transport system substrate-binding protein [Halohasta litchfieldiae]|jgi:iron complex transport system substrate-binding protein|uniref:Iron complex transport system substrate-binding protein n=1 Tax=Halohasta litchfieldiae TaxID=1073996 RepID=A0A1H6SX12_9EURY|nr:cobalamin-binding protein [Halohasta litchfieldiae]ATW89829.1 iron complex transport system substrate-binding protein [Halohasta litchfieldiae]SEI68550.1 iron complex transport system substrate-binding protein [Halohasta litchfieldiae]
MSSLRIVSLAPSATATLSALGLAEQVVGVTAHCDLDRPVVGGWLNPDYDEIAALSPDLVCTSDGLQREIRDELRGRGYSIHHDEPSRLDDVLAGFESLGVAVDAPEAGADLRADATRRLDLVAERVDQQLAGTDADTDRSRPAVYCEEWSDPPMAAGNWVPDAVEAAGGRYPFVDPGERSQEVDHETVAAADPDHAVLHICGTGDQVSPDRLTERGWELDWSVHVVDDSLLNQPSPRLIDGIELLAERLYSI